MNRVWLSGLSTLLVALSAIPLTATAANDASLSELLGSPASASSAATPAQAYSSTPANSTSNAANQATPTTEAPATAASTARPAQSAATPAATAATTPASTSTPSASTAAAGGSAGDTTYASRHPKVKNRVLEEIVVTAEKRSESIQSVPISIQAFNGASLGARNIQSVQDLGQSVPSLNFTKAAGYLLLYIRGIGTDEFIPSADPSIATYVDGIYIPQSQAGAQSLGQIKRVEVLKGPQGTLFGRDAIGGAINIITEKPGDEFKGSVKLQYSRFNDRLVQGAVSGPITSWLSASASVAYNIKDPYYKAEFFKLSHPLSRLGRLVVNIHPTDNLSLNLVAYHASQNNVNLAAAQNTKLSLLGKALFLKQASDNYTLQTDQPVHSKSYQNYYYGIFKWHLPWFDFKMLGSVQQLVVNFYPYDFDGTSTPVAVFDSTNEPSHVQSGEIQFISNNDTPWSDKLKWVFGLYYFHSLVAFNPARFHAAGNLFAGLQDYSGVQFPPVLNNLLNSLGGIAPNSPIGQNGLTLLLSGGLGTYSASAYTQLTYHVTDELDLTLGGRYQYERRFLTFSHTDVLNPTGGGTIPVLQFPLGSTPAYNFSPKVELSYHFRPGGLIYASYSSAYKSGTYNIVNFYLPANYIKPEKVTAYELGSKISFFGGNLVLNDAIFYNQIRDLQTGVVSLLSGGAVQFFSAPKAKSYGAELEGTLVPLPDLDPGLVLTANGAYVLANFVKYPSGAGFEPNTGIFLTNQNYSGNRINLSPTFSGGIGFVQTIPFYKGSLEIGVNEYFNGGFYYDAANTVLEHPYAVTNARVSYEYEPLNLRLTVFGQNILDRQYHVQQFQTDFGLLTQLAPPVVYGARLEWNFGGN